MKRSLVPYTRLRAAHKELSVPIYIGEKILADITTLVSTSRFSRVAILTDKHIVQHWGELFNKIFAQQDLLIIVEPGEEQKNMHTVQHIWTTLLNHKFDRKSLIINIGGGVVCDMGAFAASTYMRGIPFIQVPTTLLAQTDAAIGGKTGIDFGDLKNTIGTFAQPLAVICDVKFLSTLPQREYTSGFAEVIKHALIADAKLFKFLQGKEVSKLKDAELKEILQKSCAIKCKVVSEDETEKGERKILNFGHTFGHAIEMASYETGKPLLHGEAIAIGMIAESRLSLLAGLISAKECDSIEKLIEKAKLPTRASKSMKGIILDKIVSDKKNEGQKIKWVLLKGIGKAVYNVEQSQKNIQQAIDYVLV